jgi:hypothetical protein
MPKFNAQTLEHWEALAASFLASRNLSVEQVQTGRDAWQVAHMAGITREAYADRSVTDGHIQTALEKIFPAAKFLDKKVY